MQRKTIECDTAVLLVGGKGSRLYPLTKTRPKPLVHFLCKPIVQYQIEQLSQAGIKKLILCLNYFSEQFVEKAEEWEKQYGIKIIFSKEDITLDTAGPIGLAKKYITGDAFLCLNTDIYSQIDFKQLITCYNTINEKEKCNVLVLTKEVEDPTKYGLIKHSNKKVIYFLEKPKTKEEFEGCNTCTINAGIYIISSRILDLFEPKQLSMEKEIFPVVAKSGSMFIYEYNGIWGDIGVPKEYLKTQKIALEAQGNESNVFVGKNVKIGKNVFLENCTVMDNCVLMDECVVKNTILGLNCVVEEKVVLENEETLVVADFTRVSTHFLKEYFSPNLLCQKKKIK
ncbi:mpg1 [Ecytonucleospora hepatopenaei]|uniref:mannose-1-phosphate guanylyltransferase n=1 Tax=Ecytonucleospora hepatopenaei TaxID=646526 RepID=A0A1W0E8F7_9MICR|nr:mpg1 [Ecytonucleospora hepatopenaei]